LIGDKKAKGARRHNTTIAKSDQTKLASYLEVLWSTGSRTTISCRRLGMWGGANRQVPSNMKGKKNKGENQAGERMGKRIDRGRYVSSTIKGEHWGGEAKKGGSS